MTERLHPPRRPLTAAAQVSRIQGALSRLQRRYKMWIFFGLLHPWQWRIYNNSFKDTTISRSYKYLNFPHGVSVSYEHIKTNAATKGKHGLIICPWPPKNMPQIKASSSRVKSDTWRRRHYFLSKHWTPLTQWHSTTSQQQKKPEINPQSTNHCPTVCKTPKMYYCIRISCLHRTSTIIKHFIIQLMHNI